MNKIIILPENVSSKIAAGEVIERPSSVIRELIDNSIDSGSSEMTIKTIDAGIEKIIVSDNGNGISKEDLPLVFAKHATSKIHDIDDLLK
jgi:DNA mismatch repair protein MutL